MRLTLLVAGGRERDRADESIAPAKSMHDARSACTVEIDNTDAEGRVVLCDALACAAEDKPALLVDFATLTGAARIALGPDLPALYANDESRRRRLARRLGRATRPGVAHAAVAAVPALPDQQRRGHRQWRAVAHGGQHHRGVVPGALRADDAAVGAPGRVFVERHGSAGEACGRGSAGIACGLGDVEAALRVAPFTPVPGGSIREANRGGQDRRASKQPHPSPPLPSQGRELQPALLPREPVRLDTIPHAELPDRFGQVVAHGPARQIQLRRDLRRRHAIARKPQHLPLAIVERIGIRSTHPSPVADRSRARRDAPCARLRRDLPPARPSAGNPTRRHPARGAGSPRAPNVVTITTFIGSSCRWMRCASSSPDRPGHFDVGDEHVGLQPLHFAPGDFAIGRGADALRCRFPARAAPTTRRAPSPGLRRAGCEITAGNPTRTSDRSSPRPLRRRFDAQRAARVAAHAIAHAAPGRCRRRRTPPRPSSSTHSARCARRCRTRSRAVVALRVARDVGRRFAQHQRQAAFDVRRQRCGRCVVIEVHVRGFQQQARGREFRGEVGRADAGDGAAHFSQRMARDAFGFFEFASRRPADRVRLSLRASSELQRDQRQRVAEQVVQVAADALALGGGGEAAHFVVREFQRDVLVRARAFDVDDQRR